ncbi:MAG: uracil-DNA glycosylase [Alphaproteobacteria bacterium]|nr:uracil-DNA glycosylase [Alphaproteobacteria bacterium]
MAAADRRVPPPDCGRCPRLVDYRAANRAAQPAWHNAPVGSFGPADARLVVVGLAPGRGGANRTGRPFTGDYAGDVLYAALLDHGFARGTYRADPDDDLELVDCRVTNAVRCVPPENKPTGAEIANCRPFLRDELTVEPCPQVVLCLGRVAFDASLRALGEVAGRYAFDHGAMTAAPAGPTLVASYHTSRYNLNTGRLTRAMFDAVMAAIRRLVPAG